MSAPTSEAQAHRSWRQIPRRKSRQIKVGRQFELVSRVVHETKQVLEVLGGSDGIVAVNIRRA